MLEGSVGQGVAAASEQTTHAAASMGPGKNVVMVDQEA